MVDALWITPEGHVRDAAARLFDVQRHQWLAAVKENASLRDEICTRGQAIRHLVGKGARRLPVGVIGPNDATDAELALAEQAGAAIAGLGLPMICGGRGGCMEAASRGHAKAGGLVIGMLPSNDWMDANAHVAIPIATGFGEARNAIITSACFALIAVGGGHGTLSEMALGLKMERLVIAMPTATAVQGAQRCETIDAAMNAVANRYLGLGDLGHSA